MILICTCNHNHEKLVWKCSVFAVSFCVLLCPFVQKIPQKTNKKKTHSLLTVAFFLPLELRVLCAVAFKHFPGTAVMAVSAELDKLRPILVTLLWLCKELFCMIPLLALHSLLLQKRTLFFHFVLFLIFISFFFFFLKELNNNNIFKIVTPNHSPTIWLCHSSTALLLCLSTFSPSFACLEYSGCKLLRAGSRHSESLCLVGPHNNDD